MKLRLDIPNQFAFDHYPDHATIRTGYTNVIQAAIRVGLELEVTRAQLIRGKRFEVQAAAEIRYAYHTEMIGDQVYCLKPSALPRYWFFDRCGYSGWSQMANDPVMQEAGKDFDLRRARKFISAYRKGSAGRNLSKLDQPATPLEKPVAGLQDFIFLPLQVDHDRVLTHLPWQQSDTLRRVAELAALHRKPVVIKRHPLCESEAIAAWLDTVTKSNFVFVSEGSIHDLIAGCSCVLVANSGVGLEALLQGKPVYSMARSEYRHMTRSVETLAALESVFTDPPPGMPDLIDRQLGFFFLEYMVDSTDVTAIEARLRQHLNARTGFARGQAQKTQQVRAHSENVLTERAHKHLSMTVELMLKTGLPETKQAQAEWIRILGLAGALGIKRERILNEGGPAVCYQVARRLITNDEELKSAFKFAREALKSPKYRGRSLLLLARVAMANGHEERAIAELRRSTAYSDATEETYVTLAECLVHQGSEHHSEAVELVHQALTRNPALPTAHLLLAKVEMAQGRKDDAMRSFMKAQEIDAAHPAVIDAGASFMPRMRRDV